MSEDQEELARLRETERLTLLVAVRALLADADQVAGTSHPYVHARGVRYRLAPWVTDQESEGT